MRPSLITPEMRRPIVVLQVFGSCAAVPSTATVLSRPAAGCAALTCSVVTRRPSLYLTYIGPVNRRSATSSLSVSPASKRLLAAHEGSDGL